MIDLSSITAVSGILAAIGVLIGVVLAILELRNITKTRQMELIMSIYSRLSTREFLEAWEKMRTGEFKDYDGYVKKHGLVDLNIVGWVFEGLGFLLHRGFLDIDTVRELMSESTKMTWEKSNRWQKTLENNLVKGNLVDMSLYTNGGNTSTMN